MKINKHIEIVCSSKAVLSSMSPRSWKAIYAVLSEHYAHVGVTVVNTLSDLEALAAKRPDLVFLGMKFVPLNPALGLQDPDKIWVSDYLDEQGIAYTGSAQIAHELELDKSLAKQRVQQAGLETSRFYLAVQGQALTSEAITLNYPVFIKPSNRGGGLGVDGNSIAHNFAELQTKVQSIATAHRSDALIEEYLPGREFSVAILKHTHSAGFSVMPIELVAEANANGDRLLGGAMKSSNAECVSLVTDKVIKSKVSTLALEVFHALGARDYGRIDIRLDAYGTPQFLEANLIPSLISNYGSFPKACVLHLGLDHEPMILKIAALGMVRNDTPPTNLFEQEPAFLGNGLGAVPLLVAPPAV